jgi:hypothetical protein
MTLGALLVCLGLVGCLTPPPLKPTSGAEGEENDR